MPNLLVRPFSSLLVAALLLPASQAFAARPFITDDARVVDGGACQLESWKQFNRDGHENWAFPGCNPTGNLEITIGGNKLDLFDDGVKARDYYFQGKTLFKTLQPNSWGTGMALGVVLRPRNREDEKELHNIYGYNTTSFSFRDDWLVIHTNLGFLSDRSARRDFLTYGVGGELEITKRLYAIAETYGNHDVQLSYQAGFRYWIVPNHWQVDLTFGGQKGNDNFDGRWYSIGVRLLTDPFMRLSK